MVVFPEALYRLRMWQWFCPGEFNCVVPVIGARSGEFICQPRVNRWNHWIWDLGKACRLLCCRPWERFYKCYTHTHTLVVQLLHRVWLFAEPCQASLSFTISWSFPKFMSIESVILSNHFILWHPLLLLPCIFPSIRVFSNELTASGGQSTGASASVVPTSIQDWFPLGLTGWISLLSMGLSKVFSSTTVWKHGLYLFWLCWVLVAVHTLLVAVAPLVV